jgi:hypothetical protein
VFEHFHGAVGRVATEATAFSHRRSPHNVLMLSLWTEPSDGDRIVPWVRRSWGAMREFAGAGVYVNALANDADARIREAYGPNYDRLRAVKKRHDPDNFFRLNQNTSRCRDGEGFMRWIRDSHVLARRGEQINLENNR